MATVDKFVDDVNKFVTDVQAATGRGVATIADLKAALANAGLTPEQQAKLDAADQAVNDADTAANSFDVPAPPVA